jgi:type I restriction enzyme R subunit
MSTNEAFTLVAIDAQLADQGWNTLDPNSVWYEYALPDGTRADYVLCDRYGHSLAVKETRRYSVNPGDAAEQAKSYAKQVGAPYILFRIIGRRFVFWFVLGNH